MELWKARVTQDWLDFPWDVQSDSHLAVMKTRFRLTESSPRNRNLFRYLLGAHNRIKSLEADAQEAAKSYRFQVRRGDGWQKECIKLQKEVQK